MHEVYMLEHIYLLLNIIYMKVIVQRNIRKMVLLPSVPSPLRSPLVVQDAFHTIVSSATQIEWTFRLANEGVLTQKFFEGIP